MPLYGLHPQSSPRRRGPRRRLHPGGRSAGSSPGSATGSCPYSEDGKSYTKQYGIVCCFIPHIVILFFKCSLCNLFPPLQNVRTNLAFGHPLSETDGSPKSHRPLGWRANKNSAFSDGTEINNLLQKLSSQPLDIHQSTGPGDTDSLSSYTSGWEFSFLSSVFM